MQKKGLKNIKTMRDVSMPKPKPEERRIGHQKVSVSSQQRSIGRFQPRTWVFTREPGFERFQKSLLVDKIQEPYINIYEDTESVLVLADLPGVKKKNIVIKTMTDILLIEATAETTNGTRKYLKEVLIPFEIEPHRIDSTLNNGILEITLYRLINKKKRRNNKNG